VKPGVLSCLRNALIAAGFYWVSTWAIVPLAILFGKFDQRIVYGDSILAAILMGVMLSLARAVAAGAAGICITLVADGKRPEFWAIIPSVLYATRMFRGFSHPPASTWYRVMMNVDRFFPAIVCIALAFLVAKVRPGQRGKSTVAHG